jgi:DHA1 family bicyclomycin/chloramphenicol resistance-like MFS transporter
MTPVPHVAGMAAALLGTISTAGGALLGSCIDNAFDGTVRPFAVGAFVLALAGAFSIFVIAGRTEDAEVPLDAEVPVGAIS